MPSKRILWHALVIVSHLTSISICVDNTSCKATPGSSSWPSDAVWSKFNLTLSGRLLRPQPPGAACHPDQPTFNNATCNYISAAWQNSTFHDQDPVSVDYNNWSNDSCLPSPIYPCSGKGYPVYVVNASSAQDIKNGIDFAREKNIRLVAKSTGHDYLGRSIAPYSLSIWTHHLRGLSFHSAFVPKGCSYQINTTAVTVGAGAQMEQIYLESSKVNQTIVGGMDLTVSVGGFLTGGGHSPLSATYGLGADQVLEIEVVTAAGEILTVNECQNSDLFWALRGGGGASFGIVTSFTIKTFPSPPVTQLSVVLGAALDSEAYWNTVAYLLSQSPRLCDAGVSAYTYIARQTNNGNSTISGYEGLFFGFNTSINAFSQIFAPIQQYINSTWPGQVLVQAIPTQFPDFHTWWQSNVNPSGVGVNDLIGSRLLDGSALSQPLPVLEQTLRAATPYNAAAIAHLVSGPRLWSAKPRGGSDSVNPAWRKTYVHFVISQNWPSLNATAQSEAETLLNTEYTEALRKLNPDSGCYQNEAYPNEPNYQQAFWGSNYPRLLAIKRQVDPDNLFWCHPCVGDEDWRVVGSTLCRI